tara:strand:+ start:34929 stop:35111 length:183 start_codon:yes stop_codon:yes gene_type:complete
MDARIKKEAPIFNGIDKMPIGKLKFVKEYRERIKPQDYKSSTAGVDTVIDLQNQDPGYKK